MRRKQILVVTESIDADGLFMLHGWCRSKKIKMIFVPDEDSCLIDVREDISIETVTAEIQKWFDGFGLGYTARHDGVKIFVS